MSAYRDIESSATPRRLPPLPQRRTRIPAEPLARPTRTPWPPTTLPTTPALSRKRLARRRRLPAPLLPRLEYHLSKLLRRLHRLARVPSLPHSSHHKLRATSTLLQSAGMTTRPTYFH